MTEFKNILVEKKDEILLVTINREKVLNTLSKDTVFELQQLFCNHWSDKEIKCVILTGTGKAFVAGADISEIASLNVQTGTDFSQRGLFLLRTIQTFPKPVIAAINGFALGGGCELALACDIRLGSEKAKIGQPEVNLGVIPGFGGTQRLPRLVGRSKAMQLILTGEIIDAAEAYRIGLLDEVYPAHELMDKAMEMAKLIASKAPLAIEMSKEAIDRGLETSLAIGCEFEKVQFGQICGTEDKDEGTSAFMEKRAPVFTGK